MIYIDLTKKALKISFNAHKDKREEKSLQTPRISIGEFA